MLGILQVIIGGITFFTDSNGNYELEIYIYIDCFIILIRLIIDVFNSNHDTL